ncbi:hypothetical protein [Allocoleopsis franciscana]|uniref:hypothetical protein n=1 Tax=Allocoleopsis franciscana TaxID=2886352 RepID=UPI00030A5019|nr:hypothetical protein [Allocoleopsis franciscana]
MSRPPRVPPPIAVRGDPTGVLGNLILTYSGCALSGGVSKDNGASATHKATEKVAT